VASSFTNKQIAKLLNEVVAALEVKGQDRFRLNAYRRAADAIAHSSTALVDLWEQDALEKVPGIGASIAGYLKELFETGQVRHFKRIKKGLPPGMFTLLEIPGVGPKSAYKFAKELRISTPAELRQACEQGKVASLEGFGEESQAKILKGIAEMERRSERMLLPFAQAAAEAYLGYLKKNPKVKEAYPLGSLRRLVATVGDIDIAVATDDPPSVVSHFVAYPQVMEIVSQGGKKATVILKNGAQVDLMTQSSKGFGSLLQHFTGSKHHNIHLRSLAKDKGLSLSEYGIKITSASREPGSEFRKFFNRERGIYEFPDEKTFYNFLGLPWIPPELREDTGEIEAALEGKLPLLIESSDIKGDLQMHTRWSDGANSLEEMVSMGFSLGYEYLGITDHAPSVKVRGRKAVLKMILSRRAEFDKVRAKHPGIKVLFGIECNVDTSGKMALPDDILSKFDYVIASLHTGLSQSKERITQRILSALSNPYVTFIAHPAGRLLEERGSYEADWGRIFKEAARLNKWLEINAHPARLDLPDTLAREAKEQGVKLVINTDAHLAEGLGLMRFGVSVARKAWCEKSDVINTQNYSRLVETLAEIRKGR